jgi:formylmethanofuran dehydrogenase subunit B
MGCGCACDDIVMTAGEPKRTCPLGDAWFAERGGDRPPLARLDGREVSVDEAADAAAAILREARAPLVYGLGQTSCEAQRRTVALAEALGAAIDVGAATGAFAAIGSSTATLGEIRDRAELVVIWQADPVVTHPRLLERLRLDAARCVVADTQRTATADEAGEYVALATGAEFEALWALRALATGAPLDRGASSPRDGDGSLPRGGASSLAPLAERLRGVRHVAFIHGALAELTALALLSLVRDLARDRHAVTLGLRGDGNARGAEDVLAWQTGFAAPVDFARGVPRETAGAAELLERGEVDAALVVAADPLERLPGLRALPTVVVDPRATATADAARVAFATAADGIEVPGTVHRMDGVPLPLRAPRTAERPSVEDVLTAIAERL